MNDKELIDQIYSMCVSDEKAEKERQHYYETEARGDPVANIQYGSTSHGRAIEAAKIMRFIRQHKEEYK